MERFGLSWSRLGNLLPVLFGITVVSFVLIRLVPGDPASQILGNRYTPEAARQIRDSLGLNDSIARQYWIFLRSAADGSFGQSYQYHRPVGELLAARVGPSLSLVAATAVLCALISVPLGLLAALRRGGA
ncbi:MAG: ABC transporter permease, partial [Janthinobacterium lividum]